MIVTLALLAASAYAEPDHVLDLAADQRPASAEWDRAVSFGLLVEYDLNGSGAIDRRREVDAIPCGVWRELDLAIATTGSYPGLLLTYGFREDLNWVGHALGFHRRARRRAERAMRSCGISEEGPEVQPGFAGDAGPMAELMSAVADSLPGLDETDIGAVLGLLVSSAHDDDGSGAIDSPRELADVACVEWEALDRVVRKQDGLSLVRRFGLREDLEWRGYDLNLDPGLRDEVIGAVRECGLPDTDVVEGALHGEGTHLLADRIRALPGGGSSVWDRRVRGLLLGAHDHDRSGVLDTPDEVRAVPCAVWSALDEGVAAGGRYDGFVRPYGLPEGTYWLGDQLGLAESVRAEVHAVVTGCLAD